MDRGKHTVVTGFSRQKAHRFVRENLSAFLDGALPEKDMQRIQRHLSICPECRQEAEMLQATIRLLRAMPRERVPRPFALSPQAAQNQQRVRRLDSLYSALRLASVALACLLVALVSGERLIAKGEWPLGGAEPRVRPLAMERIEEIPLALTPEEAAEAPLRVMALPQEEALPGAEPTLAPSTAEAEMARPALPTLTPYPFPAVPEGEEVVAAAASITEARTAPLEGMVPQETAEAAGTLALEAPGIASPEPPEGESEFLAATEDLPRELEDKVGEEGEMPMPTTPEVATVEQSPTLEEALAMGQTPSAPEPDLTPTHQIVGLEVRLAAKGITLIPLLRQAAMIVLGGLLAMLGGLLWVWHLRRTTW